MTGNFEDLETTSLGDHRLVEQGFISVVPHKVDTTDYSVMEELGRKWNFNVEI